MHAGSTDARLDALGAKIDDLARSIDGRFEQIDRRFDDLARSVDRRFEQVDRRLETLEGRFFYLQLTLLAGFLGLIATLVAAPHL